MCQGCGFPQAPGPWTEAGAQTPGERLRARMESARRLRAWLAPLGLTVDDTHPVPGYRIATRSGEVALAPDLPSLWAEVERLLGRPFDPLTDDG